MQCPPHRWVLATPSGPTIDGKCKHCSETRVFNASWDEEKTAFNYAEKGRGSNYASQHKPEGYVLPSEARKKFGVTRGSMEHALREGRIPFVKAGNVRWVRLEDVEYWLQKKQRA